VCHVEPGFDPTECDQAAKTQLRVDATSITSFSWYPWRDLALMALMALFPSVLPTLHRYSTRNMDQNDLTWIGINIVNNQDDVA